MKHKFKIWFITISILLIGLHFFAVTYANKMVANLKVNPSPDLYANDYQFQYLAYWLSNGIFWLIGLVLIVSLVLIALDKTAIKTHNKPIKRD